MLAVATKNSISHLVGILNLCLVIKKIDFCCLIVKEMAKVSYHFTLPRILSTQVFSLSYIILIVWRPLREGREVWNFSSENAASCDKNHLSMALYTLQTPNSYYEKKKPLKTGKNLLILSKTLFVTIARIWDSQRFSVSQKVFSTRKSWFILNNNFLDLGMEFVYEKMLTYEIVSPRNSIFSMRTFWKLEVFQQALHTLLYRHQINSFQLQICLGTFKNEP